MFNACINHIVSIVSVTTEKEGLREKKTEWLYSSLKDTPLQHMQQLQAKIILRFGTYSSYYKNMDSLIYLHPAPDPPHFPCVPPPFTWGLKCHIFLPWKQVFPDEFWVAYYASPSPSGPWTPFWGSPPRALNQIWNPKLHWPSLGTQETTL